MVTEMTWDDFCAQLEGREIPRDLRDLADDFSSEGFFDDASHFRDEDDEHSARHDEYVAWLRTRLQLEPVTDPDALVASARERYQQRFATWMARFVAPA